jgi:hypothetical protein
VTDGEIGVHCCLAGNGVSPQLFDGPSRRAIESYWGQGAGGAAKIAVRNCAQFRSDFLSLIAEVKMDVSLLDMPRT